MFGTFVTGNFFPVLRANAAMGRALTAADDDPRTAQAVMVLSHRGWDRLFARDPAIVGRHVLVNGFTFEVVGVMPEGFRGLMVAPDDYWAPLSLLGRVRPIAQADAADVSVQIVGRLKPGMSWETARAGLAVWDAGQPDRAASARGASIVTLTRRDGTVGQPLEAVAVVAPLVFAFGLILLIGCANVANLLLARAVARQREIGIQLSLGASRRRIVRQLLTESLLLAFVAAGVGFVISRVVLDLTIAAIMDGLKDLGDIRLSVPDADWRVALFLIVGAVLSTISFGLAPALQATRIDPVRTMRGEVIADARPGRARHFLIGLQVSASALLLICAAVFLRSTLTSVSHDPGMRTSDTVAIEIPNEQSRAAIVQAMRAESSVANIAAAWLEAPATAFAEVSGVKAGITYKFVSSEYFSVFDIPVMRGRAFTPAERSSSQAVAIVSETTARALWPNADAVGQVIRLDTDATARPQTNDGPPLESRTFIIAGVVRDVPGFRIMPFNKAVVYIPTSLETPKTSLAARIHGNPDVARQTLLTKLTAVDPGMARQVTTLRTIASFDISLLQIGFQITVVLGALALTLTLSGLFSVLSYLVEQRSKEIGVRMALGATAGDVTRLVLAQLIKPVGIGLVVGGGSAAGLATALLAVGGAATIGHIVRVFDPVAYALSVLIIVAACLVAASIPAARAARLDPTWTLRRE
jgi:predicted permease